VGQAAAAFRIWFGLSPNEASALQACREAVAARA
jgi:shikimate 5-dehydrogenase